MSFNQRAILSVDWREFFSNEENKGRETGKLFFLYPQILCVPRYKRIVSVWGRWEREFQINGRLVLQKERFETEAFWVRWGLRLKQSLLLTVSWNYVTVDREVSLSCGGWVHCLKAATELVEIIHHRVDGRWADNTSSHRLSVHLPSAYL